MKQKTGFFFERQNFSNPEISQPYYIYRGYCLKNNPGHYPFRLHFDRDEIFIAYVDEDGSAGKVFSLPVAEGEISQKSLSEKIEKYWKMPLWVPPNGKKKEDIFLIDRTLLKISFFPIYNGFEFDSKNKIFYPSRLFSKKSVPPELTISHQDIVFAYQNRCEQNCRTNRLIKDNKFTAIWNSKNNKRITTNHINFRHILLDFLFELDNTKTFEDKAFYELQPTLKNNRLLDALTRKAEYVQELHNVRDFHTSQSQKELYKPFKDREKQWLEVCFRVEYQDVFTSSISIFEPEYEEVKQTIYHSNIGRAKENRRQLFTQNDIRLQHQVATFFLRQHALWNGFRTLMHPAMLFLFLAGLVLILFGDLLLSELNTSLVGLFCFGVPPLFLLITIGYYLKFRINLFRLMLPRLFLGIMIGWASFWDSEGAWETALISKEYTLVLMNIALFVVMALFIYTDIRNKLIRAKEISVVVRTFALLSFAMLISLVQGFYVLQVKAVPVLLTSDFLIMGHILKKDDPRLGGKTQENRKLSEAEKIDVIFNNTKPSFDTKEKEFLKNEYFDGDKLFGRFKRGISIKAFNKDDLIIYYIWPLLLSQFMVAIIIGLALQLLWEDKSITEPL